MYRDSGRAHPGRTPVWGLVFLAFLAVVLAVFPLARLIEGSLPGAWVLSAYLAAVAVALFAVLRAARSGERRGFWALVGCGILLRFVGNLGWMSAGTFELPAAGLAVHDVAYALSYAALLAALFVLVEGAVSGLSRITAVAALDAACITLSVGLLVWYFALGGMVLDVPGAGDERATLMFVLKPAADAALLSVALVLYAGPRRPVFVPYLAAAFACLLFADALHLAAGPAVVQQSLGGPPEALRAVGFVLLCLGALRATDERAMRESGAVLDAGRGALSFWFGPLSPALHCGVLLGWGAVFGPLPPGILGGSALVVGYSALRSGMTARANRALRRERERLVVREERARISESLHDALKQELHAVPLLLELHREDRKEGTEYLERAISLSKAASERVRLSVSELRDAPEQGSCARELILKTLSDLGPFLPFKVHDALDGSLASLSSEEALVACRVVSEALWNAAKHSGAGNVRVTSRLDGDVPTLSVRDDGRGFDPERTRPGYGTSLMHRRAERVGASLTVAAEPGAGTEVRIGFTRRPC